MSAAQEMSIRPMAVGAEVLGLQEGDEKDEGVRARLYDAWLEHGILLFHGISSIERHLALSEVFGELEIHPFPPARSELHPLLIALGGPKKGPAYIFDETEIRCNRIAWHRDTAYTPDICKGAVLRMVEVPARHGETMLCDTAKAYDDLPETMKQRLEGLEFKASLRLGFEEQTRPGAIWKTVRPAGDISDAAYDGTKFHSLKAQYPSVVHPAVLTHPESGRKCIFLSPTYVDFFLGMRPEESDALLKELVAHMLQPRYVYVHRWAADDAILWDNRRFMHAAPGNEPEEPRFGLRTTLAGPVRTGRYYDPDAQAKQAQLVD